MKQFLYTKKGFSIVEVLVAVSILGVGLALPMTIAFQAIQTSNIARDQVIAFYLAQEGIELVRYVRDTNILEFRIFLFQILLKSNI